MEILSVLAPATYKAFNKIIEKRKEWKQEEIQLLFLSLLNENISENQKQIKLLTRYVKKNGKKLDFLIQQYLNRDGIQV